MKAALAGLRVLDFSHALAGPYCTYLLSAYGAEVIKVESPEGGDIGRSWAPPFAGDQSAYFLALNAGKRSISLNLKHPRGREICLRLMAESDVVLENFRPGTMDRLGLGYAEAAARNPRLIYCSISGYGQNGPARDSPAMDLILQATSGLISMTGEPGGARVRCGHSVADVTAGLFAVIGIRLARQSGAGQFVDVSMFDSMISAMSSNFGSLHASGAAPQPMGTAFGAVVPYRTFPTADGEIAMAAGSERLWRIFCSAMGLDAIAEHPDYASNADRVRNRGTLEPMLAGVFKREPSAHWLAVLAKAGVPAGDVRTLDQVAADPQAAARQMFVTLDHSSAGVHTVTGPPVKLSAAAAGISGPAPLLGEHTKAVLSELLNLSESDITELARNGVIPIED